MIYDESRYSSPTESNTHNAYKLFTRTSDWVCPCRQARKNCLPHAYIKLLKAEEGWRHIFRQTPNKIRTLVSITPLGPRRPSTCNESSNDPSWATSPQHLVHKDFKPVCLTICRCGNLQNDTGRKGHYQTKSCRGRTSQDVAPLVVGCRELPPCAGKQRKDPPCGDTLPLASVHTVAHAWYQKIYALYKLNLFDATVGSTHRHRRCLQ